MHLFSHAVLAARLAPLFNPDNLGEYTWGAVAPDIRYLAGMRRDRTHLPREQVAGWLVEYPLYRSFIRGYQVHCLLDEISLVKVVGRAFPFNLFERVLRRKLTYQQMGMLVELYFLKTAREKLDLSGTHNEILTCLGISAAQVETYAGAVRSYLAAPSFETAFTAFQNLGLVQDSRVEKYIQAYRMVEQHPLLQWVLLMGVQNAQVERIAEEKVREIL